MAYYGAGDYYGAGGLFGFLGKVAKKAGGAALGVLGATPVGQAATAVSRAFIPSGPALPAQLPQITPPAPMRMPVSPIPTARTPYLGLPVTGAGLQPKRRRMNYGNTKALKRADRRIDGFVKVARSALRHTGYKVVSKTSGQRGSRGVITRSEAARALRR